MEAGKGEEETNEGRDGDEHKALSRPNVQMVRGYPESALRRIGRRLVRRDRKLTPQGIDILLLIVHTNILHHVIPSSGVCSICSDQEVERDLDFFVPTGG